MVLPLSSGVLGESCKGVITDSRPCSQLTPRVTLLGITFDLGVPRGDRTFVGLATLLAKRDIAKRLLADMPPTIKEWREGMDWTAKMEEHVYIARRCPGKHARIWGRWWNFPPGNRHPTPVSHFALSSSGGEGGSSPIGNRLDKPGKQSTSYYCQ